MKTFTKPEYNSETLKSMFKVCERHDYYAMAEKLLQLYNVYPSYEYEYEPANENWMCCNVDDYYITMSVDENNIFVNVYDSFDEVIEAVDQWLIYDKDKDAFVAKEKPE